MQLQNGYDVPELTSRPHHHQLLPPDHPTGYPLPPPNHQHPPFHLFFQQQQQLQQQQQQQQPVNVDPFSLGFRAGMADLHISAAATGLAPPPSVVVAPQALRWINHQEDALIPKHPPLPLWKCEGEIGHPQFHKSVTQHQMSTMVSAQFGPEFDTQNSQSAGSASEIYESTTQWTPNPESNAISRRGNIISCTGEAAKKNNNKKKKHKLCTDSDLKVMADLIEAQLAAHQERLLTRFTEAMERMERVRREREDTWRAAEERAARAHAEARAREQALASAREATILSFLERMTGEKMELPTLIGSRAGLEITKPGPKRCRKDVNNMYSRDHTSTEDCDMQYSNSENVLEAMLELQESNIALSHHKDDHDGQNL